MNIKVYDNGGESMDRFTAVYLDQPVPNRIDGMFAARGMNECPFHPMGFCQMCTAQDGPHLGKQIEFSELPEDCQKVVLRDLNPEPNPNAQVEVNTKPRW